MIKKKDHEAKSIACEVVFDYYTFTCIIKGFYANFFFFMVVVYITTIQKIPPLPIREKTGVTLFPLQYLHTRTY